MAASDGIEKKSQRKRHIPSPQVVQSCLAGGCWSCCRDRRIVLLYSAAGVVRARRQRGLDRQRHGPRALSTLLRRCSGRIPGRRFLSRLSSSSRRLR